MRVLINTIPLYGKTPGLRTYTAGLLGALRASDADMEWHVPLRPADRERLGLAGDPRFRPVALGATAGLARVPVARFAWRNAADQALALPWPARYDVAHYLDSYGPLLPLGSTPLALTVHDLLPLLPDRYFTGWVRAYLAFLMRATIPRACGILAVSHHTAAQLGARLGIPPGRIVVAPNGIDPRFRPATPEERRRVAERYRLPARYVIYVGSINPRKNVARLVRAFARARRDAGLPHALLLAGGLGWRYDDVMEAIRAAALGPAIRLLGHVPDDDLSVLLASAECLAYPSLEEGFGLPVVEAMACGTPALASSAASLREVAGDAALLVDPANEDAIHEGLLRLLGDEALRARLRAAGLARARDFGWARAGEAAIALYRRLGRGGGRAMGD